MNFQLNDAPTSLGWDLGDGQNTISFDTPDNPLSPGTVGYCNTLWWSCILGDVTFYVAGEIDVVLNATDYDYGTGDLTAGNAKFAYVLMHELGHAMRLGHVNEWGESMYPSVTDWPSRIGSNAIRFPPTTGWAYRKPWTLPRRLRSVHAAFP